MYWCFACYALNPHPCGACVRCGEPVEAPTDLSYDERLIWALGHPDGDRAVVAAQTLASRRTRRALPALRAAVEETRDPFLAVAALRGAITIVGTEELQDWLEQLADGGSFMVQAVAKQAIGSRA